MPRETNWILATPTWSDVANITAATTSSVATPASNVQTYQPTDVWTTTSSTPFIQMSHASAQEWNLVLLLFTNAEEGDLFRVRTAESELALITAPVYDSGVALRLVRTADWGAQTSTGIAAITTFTLEARFRARDLLAGWITKKAGTGNGLGITWGAGGTVNLADTTFADLIPGPVCNPWDWVHAAVVVMPGSLSLYVNGLLVDSTTTATTYDATAIHAGDPTATISANTDIDWIRFWNVARTSDQIYANRATEIASGSGLYASYSFNNASTNTGTLGGSMTMTGSPEYKFAERVWASGGLDDYDRTHGILWSQTTRSSTYMRIDFDWTANTQGIFKIGRIYVSKAHQFERNPAYGADQWTFDDPSVSTDMIGGQRVIARATPVPGMRLPFEFTNSADMNEHFFEVARTRGSSRDVAVVLNPIDTDGRRHQRIGYGTMQSRITCNVPSYGIYRGQIDLRGLI